MIFIETNFLLYVFKFVKTGVLLGKDNQKRDPLSIFAQKKATVKIAPTNYVEAIFTVALLSMLCFKL
jgi:hypothetical protein